MQLMLELNIPLLPRPVNYGGSVLMVGSCFTENMCDRFREAKFHTLSNPHGILFNPLSVADSLDSYLDDRRYKKEDLFHLNELWNSWEHHTRFSHTDADAALSGINNSQEQAAAFIKKASHVVITLGSAFQYYLKESGKPVSNNHRAPAQWFEKRLLETGTIIDALSNTIERLLKVNPEVQIIFTISPVRHIRDGVVDNNRSKARLIEAVHTLCQKYPQAYYFPAYELVIDILRDYRFYDIDFVHPNYTATAFIWEQFVHACMSEETRSIMEQVQQITTAFNHRSRFPETEAHKKFKKEYAEKVKALMQQHPFLDLGKELSYFSEG
jgi:hypothetical protein